MNVSFEKKIKSYICILDRVKKHYENFMSTPRKKHGIIPRNFVVLYHGSCRGIIPRK